jgi:hypothetical protein
LIFTAIISTIGGLAGLAILHWSWLRKFDKKCEFEKYKIDQSTKLAEKRLDLPARKARSAQIGPSGAMDWIELLKNIPRDKLAILAETFLGNEETAGSPEIAGDDVIGGLIQYAQTHPEQAAQFVANITGKGSSGSQEEQKYLG